MSRYGASTFSSLLNSCVLWAPLQHSAGVSGDIDEFPILPSGVTVTNNGTFTKIDLGNNKSVLNFDGSTNYISLSDHANWDFGSGNFTVSFWLYATALTTHRYIFSRDNNLYSPIICWISPTYNLDINITSNGSAWDILSGFTAGAISANTLYFVTLTRSGNTFTWYINGVSVNSTSGSGTILASANPFYLCAGQGNTTNRFYGYLKDYMIFSRVLTLPEIKLLMNRTHPETGAGLIDSGRYWRLS